MPLELADVSVGLLTLDQVAEQLAFAFPANAGNLLIFIKRLIARGALKATQFGEQPESMFRGGATLRVKLEDLRACIASNGQAFEKIRQEFKLPAETWAPIFPFDENCDWFTNPWAYSVSKLATAFQDDLNGQLQSIVATAQKLARGEFPKPSVDDEEARRLALKISTQLQRRTVDPINVELPFSQAIKDLMVIPADDNGPGVFLTMPGSKPNSTMFLNLTEMLLATMVQTEARQIIRTEARSNQMAMKIEDARVLYASPVEYQRLRDAAIDSLMPRSSFMASTRVPFALGGPHEEILVRISISNRRLMEGIASNPARLGSLAF